MARREGFPSWSWTGWHFSRHDGEYLFISAGEYHYGDCIDRESIEFYCFDDEKNIRWLSRSYDRWWQDDPPP